MNPGKLNEAMKGKKARERFNLLVVVRTTERQLFLILIIVTVATSFILDWSFGSYTTARLNCRYGMYMMHAGLKPPIQA